MTISPKEQYLQEWLASVNEHLDTVSSEELEKNYLAVKEVVPASLPIHEYLSEHNPAP